MNIIVISDTHMPKRAKTLPEFLVAYLKTADLIIHAGDLQTNDIYQQLLKYAPVEGVIGNVDEEELVTILPFKKIIEINGVRIGITHGHGKGKTTEKRVLSVFEGENVDIIIFGHSHIPLKKEVDGKILFNPGSPTDKRKQARYSFGRIQLGENFTIEHIFFDK
jgi:uncharacterized protein